MRIEEFCIELKQFIQESGMSKNALAKEAGVPQSQVSCWSNGKGLRFTKNAKKVMTVIESYRKTDLLPLPKEIEDAVRNAWAKNPKKKKLICDVLKAIEYSSN